MFSFIVDCDHGIHRDRHPGHKVRRRHHRDHQYLLLRRVA
jgi:hypothetical protein